MRYFFDTEFIEDGHTIDLISIGIIAEDGRELYLESADADLSKANSWVRENVLPKLTGAKTPRAQIAQAISGMIGNGNPHFWAWYGAYDWVALCQLYGRMIDLPKSFPMFFHDLKAVQVAMGLPDTELPDCGETRHNALDDARWLKQAHSHVLALIRKPIPFSEIFDFLSR